MDLPVLKIYNSEEKHQNDNFSLTVDGKDYLDNKTSQGTLFDENKILLKKIVIILVRF